MLGFIIILPNSKVKYSIYINDIPFFQGSERECEADILWNTSFLVQTVFLAFSILTNKRKKWKLRDGPNKKYISLI